MVRVIVLFLLSHFASAEQPLPADCPSSDKALSQEDSSVFIQLERGHVSKSGADMRQKTPPVLMQTAAHISQEASTKTENTEKWPDFAGMAANAASAAEGLKENIHDAEERTKEAVESLEEQAGDVKDSIQDLEDQATDVVEGLGNATDAVEHLAEQFGGEEYIDKMRNVVNDFSDKARSRVAAAQANLETHMGEANKTFTLAAVKVIVQTGKAAEKMAEQFIEQMQHAKDEVAELLVKLDAADEADKAEIAEKLEPLVKFLGELLSSSAELMGTSVEGLRGDQAVVAVKDAHATMSEKARQSLQDVDAALLMASAFADGLKVSVQQVTDLSTQLLEASDEHSVAVQQELLQSARRMSKVLMGDFVAEERARQLQATKSSAFAQGTIPLLAGVLMALVA